MQTHACMHASTNLQVRSCTHLHTPIRPPTHPDSHPSHHLHDHQPTPHTYLTAYMRAHTLAGAAIGAFWRSLRAWQWNRSATPVGWTNTSSTPFCTWTGVECTADGLLQALNLAGLSIAGVDGCLPLCLVMQLLPHMHCRSRLSILSPVCSRDCSYASTCHIGECVLIAVIGCCKMG